MIKRLVFLIVSFCLITPQLCFADEEETGNPEDIPISENTTKPRSDSSHQTNLKCKYLNGNLIFDFEMPEGTAKATVTNLNTGCTITRSFPTTLECSIQIGSDEGTYEIYVETSRGGKYIGYYIK